MVKKGENSKVYLDADGIENGVISSGDVEMKKSEP